MMALGKIKAVHVAPEEKYAQAHVIGVDRDQVWVSGVDQPITNSFILSNPDTNQTQMVRFRASWVCQDTQRTYIRFHEALAAHIGDSPYLQGVAMSIEYVGATHAKA